MDKNTVNTGIPVFGRIIKLLNKKEILSIASELNADRYTKRLDSYQHLVIYLYAVFAQLQSLRELELGFLSSASRMNHFGIDYMVRRSTFSDANRRRPAKFFAAVYEALYKRYASLLSDSRPVKGLNKDLFIFDSTTISLFSQVFKGTGRNSINGQKKGGMKAHTIIKADADVPTFVTMTDATTSDHDLLSSVNLPEGSYVTFDMGYTDRKEWQRFSEKGISYVTREKRKSKYNVLETRPIPEDVKDVVISDEIVSISWYRRIERPMTKEELAHHRGRRPKNGVVMVKETDKGTHKCRRVTKYKDKKEDGCITFITNDFDTPAAIICELYRRRWQIETLFKRLKQNFPLKYFLGDSQNAIQTQVWVCLIAWLLMQILKKQIKKRKWSMSNFMTSVRILLNSYIDLFAFLELPEKQWLNIIENRHKQDDVPYQNTLFNNYEGANFENTKTTAYLQGLSDVNP